MNFLVLCSSRGTTFQSILESIEGGLLSAKCVGLITDREDRGCVAKAKAAGLNYKIVQFSSDKDREKLDRDLDDAIEKFLQEQGVDTTETLLADMGWMWVHSDWFIEKWRNRILNVHPSLLPKFGGKGMYGDRVHEAVLAAHEEETGISIHIIDEQVDGGKILLQKSCPVLPSDTVETLRARVQDLEKEWYPKVLEMMERGELKLE